MKRVHLGSSRACFLPGCQNEIDWLASLQAIIVWLETREKKQSLVFHVPRWASLFYSIAFLTTRKKERKPAYLARFPLYTSYKNVFHKIRPERRLTNVPYL